MSMKKVTKIITYIIITVCLLLATAQAYEIIAVTSLTGPFAVRYQLYDKYIIEGVRAAVTEQNRRGGINGHRIDFFYYDDQGKAHTAAQIAKRIVRQHPNVMGIVGHSFASTTLAAMPFYAKHKIPVLVPVEQTPKITQKGYNNLFRFGGRDDWMVKYLAVVSVKKLGAKYFAIIYPRNNRQYYDYFHQALPDNTRIIYASPMSETAVSAASRALKNYGKKVQLVIFYPFSVSAPDRERLYYMKKIFNDAYGSNRWIRLVLTSYEYNDVPIFQKLSKEVGAPNYIFTSVGAENYSAGRKFIKNYGIKNNYGFYSYICGQIFFQAIRDSKISNLNPTSKSVNLNELKHAELYNCTDTGSSTYLKAAYRFKIAAVSPLITTLRQKRFETDVGDIAFNSNGDALWAPYAMYNVFPSGVETVSFNGTGGSGCCPDFDFCCDLIE
jgi:hypothetical protein